MKIKVVRERKRHPLDFASLMYYLVTVMVSALNKINPIISHNINNACSCVNLF